MINFTLKTYFRIILVLSISIPNIEGLYSQQNFELKTIIFNDEVDHLKHSFEERFSIEKINSHFPSGRFALVFAKSPDRKIIPMLVGIDSLFQIRDTLLRVDVSNFENNESSLFADSTRIMYGIVDSLSSAPVDTIDSLDGTYFSIIPSLLPCPSYCGKDEGPSGIIFLQKQDIYLTDKPIWIYDINLLNQAMAKIYYVELPNVVDIQPVIVSYSDYHSVIGFIGVTASGQKLFAGFSPILVPYSKLSVDTFY